MKLLRLEMAGFRSYREPAAIDFEPGLNVFAGPNEAGKTGVLLGVVGCLFPPRLEVDRRALVSRGGATCRLVLEYELPDGGRWRLERDLVSHRGVLARRSGGAWHPAANSLTDIAGLVREHTGCDEQLFRASLLVGHEAVEVAETGDLTRSLRERLEALVSGSASGVTAARAAEKLNKTLKAITGPQRGEIAQAQARLRDLSSRLERARAGAAAVNSRRRMAEERRAAAAALEQERVRSAAVLEAARGVAVLERQAIELEERRRAIDAALDARAELRKLRLWPVLAAGAGLALAAYFVLGWLASAAVAAATAIAAWWLRPKQDSAGLTAERARLGRDLEELRARLDERATARLPAADLAALDQRLGALPGLIKAAESEALRAEIEADGFEREAGALADLEDEAAAAQREVARLQRRGAALQLARQELEAAIEEVRAGIGPELALVASERLASVAGGHAVALDEGLSFTPVTPVGAPEPGLSDGTRDQFYFAVRLALADVLLGELRPPLMLDDPFRYADHERRAALHQLLARVAAVRQVLYFTVEPPVDLPVTHQLPLSQTTVNAMSA